jgi:hypothetical protein
VTVLVGLDVGTTGVKALAISPGGEVVAAAEEGYPLCVPQPGWAEEPDEEVLELARTAGEWLFDRRKRLEKHDREGIAFLWLHVSEIESILRGFDVLEAAGALSVEERVLQEDLIDLISGGNAPVIETP